MRRSSSGLREDLPENVLRLFMGHRVMEHEEFFSKDELVCMDHLSRLGVRKVRVRCYEAKKLAKKNQPFQHFLMRRELLWRRFINQEMFIFPLPQMLPAATPLLDPC